MPDRHQIFEAAGVRRKQQRDRIGAINGRSPFAVAVAWYRFAQRLAKRPPFVGRQRRLCRNYGLGCPWFCHHPPPSKIV